MAQKIKITNDKFVCGECQNEVEPQISSSEGIVKADLDKIKSDLEKYPTKVNFGVCPVCGMEYTFVLENSELYLQPSEEEK